MGQLVPTVHGQCRTEKDDRENENEKERESFLFVARENDVPVYTNVDKIIVPWLSFPRFGHLMRRIRAENDAMRLT